MRWPDADRTAARADRAAAAALQTFAAPGAKATRRAPAGWPSSKADVVAAERAEAKAAEERRQRLQPMHGNDSGGSRQLVRMRSKAEEILESHSAATNGSRRRGRGGESGGGRPTAAAEPSQRPTAAFSAPSFSEDTGGQCQYYDDEFLDDTRYLAHRREAPAGLEMDDDGDADHHMNNKGALVVSKRGGGGGCSSSSSSSKPNAAPSHVLVARALGPVAGRAIITERRALLERVDQTEARCRALQEELQVEKGQLPASQAREHAAEGREARLRQEREKAHAEAETARQETALVRMELEHERVHRSRAEATLEEVRRVFAKEIESLREQLEATTADWRCAEAEARHAERGLAVTQAELRAADDRVLLSEARCSDEVAKADAKWHEERKRCEEVEEQRNLARHEKAALEGELRALEQRVREAQEPIREERATLRRAIDAAESRAALAVGQLALVEKDRDAVKRELQALKLEHEAALEASAAREERLRKEAAASGALARDMAERCSSAEQQSEVQTEMLREARRASLDSEALARRMDGLLSSEKERAAAADQARREAERQRYLALHRPERVLLVAGAPMAASAGVAAAEEGVVASGASSSSASAEGPVDAVAPSPAAPLVAPQLVYQSSTSTMASSGGAAGAPWWWGTTASTTAAASLSAPPSSVAAAAFAPSPALITSTPLPTTTRPPLHLDEDPP